MREAKKYSLFSISGFELFQTKVVEKFSSNCCSNVLLTMTNNNHCCFNYLDWNNLTKSYFHFYLWENYGLYLCRSVTCARNKSAHIWRKREGHDIASVACIRCALLSRFDVPKRTKNRERGCSDMIINVPRLFVGWKYSPSHVTTACYDLVVIKEPTTT